MADLNSKIIAYLTVNNIAFTDTDFMTGQPEGEPNQILYWNTSALGTQPTQEQLDSAYFVWEEQQIQNGNSAQAQSLLSATDWTAIASVADPALSNPYLTNQAAFLSYRSEVRNIGVNPPTVPATFPTQPIATWSS
jgi:hypothetical protein